MQLAHGVRNPAVRLSHSALSQLQITEAWLASDFVGRDSFSAEQIYGPEGKLGWLWPLTWQTADEMHAALCTNMGGGVPIDVIDALVAICDSEAGQN